ncbi:hypothetical protein LPTSP4_11600 [Leptospira ryugenii]|uniref:Uncharacterized protein n=2 Tax=Leptospira ryugenii TaxID=1917863 RepID=A0A2P2DYD4_9LEPT|nr:hypothetical protein LPTSP4_11600 [Leptospira ryugenii]
MIGMKLSTWLRIRYPQFFTESKESVVLDNCLCSSFREKRQKEETILPRMSQDFDTRLLALLREEKIAPIDEQISFVRRWLENRNLQYSVSFAMVLTLALVLVSRYSSQESRLPDTAGVVLENSSYLNEPTSMELSDSHHKRVFVDSLKRDPASIQGLKGLEVYYQKTGRGSAAEEVRLLIESAEN